MLEVVVGASSKVALLQRSSVRFDDNDNTLSPLSSVCARSPNSEGPVFTRTRGELIKSMNAISTFARHYASVYHGVGLSYHSLPFSARRSEWVLEGMRFRVDEALTTSHYKQLPDLVYIFTEISHRLNNAQLLLGEQYGWQGAESQLRRCDKLLQEAEIRLRFLQSGVGNMWFTAGRDNSVTWDEGAVLWKARKAFETRWLGVLPQICFTHHPKSQESQDHLSGRRWVSWS